ncbi:MAG: S8 family serine peptidase, partial [Candidatus Eisenbacteria bacterium]|nr:S8 family serine peptidase [Candidatus Eisenbacteria bacterium]
MRHHWSIGAAILAVIFVAVVGAAAFSSDVSVGDRTYREVGDVWFLVGDSGMWEVLPGLVTIVPESGLDAVDVASIADSLGLDIQFQGPWGRYWDLRIGSEVDPIQTAGILYANDMVADAWPDTKARFTSTPSDPYYANHLNWWRQWNLFRIEAEDAWGIETGDTNIVLALIDDGIEQEHEELEGNLWVNWTEYYGLADTDDDNNGYVDDIHGANMTTDDGDVEYVWHGVCVAGIMAAQTNNDSTGIAGLAGGWYGGGWSPGQRGSGCVILTAASSNVSEAELREGVVYAARNGAHVANMSFEFDDEDEAWDAVIDTAVAAGMVLVAAAGNDADSVGFPAAYPEVIAVGASDYRDSLAWWSSLGSQLDVLAPSGACPAHGNRCKPKTCWYQWSDDWKDDECVHDSLFLWTTYDDAATGYDFFSGTSAAAPQVAALAGLMMSLDASLSRTEIRELLRHSAEDMIGGTSDKRGRDATHGYGRINAYAALFLARGGGATSSNLRLCYDVEFDRDVKISSGDTLTLLPGVEVTFASNSDAANLGIDTDRCELIVEGTLIAEGTHADTLVTFTTEVDSAGAWYGIRALADTGTIHMEYCAVENAYKGIAVEAPDSLYVSEVTIEDCVTHGISCKECDSSMTVASCTITDPGLIGIDADECDGLVLSDHDISDATVYGIRCLDAEGMTVEDNTILGASGESGFVGIHYACASGDTTLTIEDNTISRCGARGIYCEGGGDGTSSITGNVISDDGYDRGAVGIYLKTTRAEVRYNNAEKKGTGVAVLPGLGTPKWLPDLGRDASGEYGNNSWLDNATWHVWTLLQSPDTLRAERNWHGADTVSAGMFSPTVDYIPVLTDTVARRVTPGGDEAETYEYALSQNRPNPFNPTTTI